MSEKVIVTVKEGKIQGFKTKSIYSEIEYYTFLGVPYGQSTGGSARFKDPVKVKPWNNILNATAEKGGCIQFSLFKHKIMGSEDCLYNNIYTPQLPSKGDTLKAVIAYVHPGGSYHGSPDPSYYGNSDYIMHKDVVYVCIGFRLHFFGHLNLHTKGCSGNQSLKDVILSLEWIKENVAVFGGDPENITIMGGSSGCSLVHALLLSPLGRGLYHKAILMGCYIFNPFFTIPSDHIPIAYDVAKSLQYNGPPDDHKKLFSFYRKLNALSLIAARSERYFHKSTWQVFPAAPLWVSPEPGENSPIPLPMRELIPAMNKVPILIGFCEKEAYAGLVMFRNLKCCITDCFPNAIRQNEFGWGATLTEEELKLIRSEVENFYLKGQSIETASQLILCDMLTDAALSDLYDTLINVVSVDPTAPVYVYNFHYDGKLCSALKAKLDKFLDTPLKGAFHGADYFYWSNDDETAGKNMSQIKPMDRQIIETFTSLLTTFAKTSNPNYEGMDVQWKPTTPDSPSHLIIDEKLEARDELLNGERMEFWHKLKNKLKNNCKNVE